MDLYSDDKEETASTKGEGLWQLTVISFGVLNAPVTFDRLMETVLRELAYELCLVYLDDMIVIDRTFQEHMFNLQMYFSYSEKPA
jgi:hypothetical protein